jgi:hypothetical protein
MIAAHGGGPGERDDPHERIGNQGLACVRPARDDVQLSLGQPGFLEDPRHRDPAADGGTGVGLEDDRVAEGSASTTPN